MVAQNNLQMSKKINQIKEILVREEVSQKELAENLGKNEDTISYWCINKSQHHLKELHKNAELLKVDICDLLLPVKKEMGSKTHQIKAIVFLCSPWGDTCGFRRAGFKVLGEIDIDSACKETYESNKNARFLLADVSNLAKEEVGKFFKIRKNQRDLIFVRCSPCQYFSNIKTDKTNSLKSRLLLEDFQEFVDFYRLGYIFIGNAPGFDTNQVSPIGKFKRFLKEIGYVFSDKIINAKHYGVPQGRNRCRLLTTRVNDKDKIPEPDKKAIRTVQSAISDIEMFPPITAGHTELSPFKHTAASLSKLNLKRIKHIPHNGGDRRSWPDKIKSESNKKHGRHYYVYGRMFCNKPVPTITPRFNSYSNGRYGHPNQAHEISLRETATLQNFTHDYKFFSDSQGTVAKIIGNAVPPELAKRMVQTFL